MARTRGTLLPRALPPPSTTACSLLSTTSSSQSRPTTAWVARPATYAQIRYASEVVRPKKPFTFTQIIQLSDGSTYTTRSTSPLPVYRSSKDTRNHIKWQPTESTLRNVEVDEAGKLASFRERFGSVYDQEDGGNDSGANAAGDSKGGEDDKGHDANNFSALLSSYVRDDPNLKGGRVEIKGSAKGKKKK